MNENYTEQRIQTVCLIVLSAIAVVVCLHWLKPVVVPFLWAVFFSIILGPLVTFLTRSLRLPRPLALVVTLLVVFAAVLILGALIASSIRDFAATANQYADTVEQLLKKVAATGILQKLGIPRGEAVDLGSLIPTGAMRRILLAMTNAFLSLLSWGLMVMLFVIFLMVGQNVRGGPSSGVMGEIETGVKRYISTKVLVSAATGLLVFVVLAMLGVPYAISFGAFAFLLNFIPTIGSVISTLLPLPILLLTPGITWTTSILAIAIPGIIQLAMGNAVEPKMMGKSLGLHPITVLLALIFWGMIWGFDGMILAVPITAVVKLILEKIEITSSVALLMAGEWSSTTNRAETASNPPVRVQD
jgi:AI-2 transport protein TqsA